MDIRERTISRPQSGFVTICKFQHDSKYYCKQHIIIFLKRRLKLTKINSGQSFLRKRLNKKTMIFQTLHRCSPSRTPKSCSKSSFFVLIAKFCNSARIVFTAKLFDAYYPLLMLLSDWCVALALTRAPVFWNMVGEQHRVLAQYSGTVETKNVVTWSATTEMG